MLTCRELSPDRFKFVSEVISQYYPAPLQEGCLITARYALKRVRRFSGAQIITMGVAECAKRLARWMIADVGPIQSQDSFARLENIVLSTRAIALLVAHYGGMIWN